MTDCYVYYIDGKKFTADNYFDIPHYDTSSPNENTPAIENLSNGSKVWCKKGYIYHRLTGPAVITNDGEENFYINDRCYFDIQTWLKVHPNPDLYFDTLGMNETDRVLWFLQN
jgi:hypothetical protein